MRWPAKTTLRRWPLSKDLKNNADVPFTYLESKNPRGRNRRCKVPEIGLFLEGLRNSRAGGVAEAE